MQTSPLRASTSSSSHFSCTLSLWNQLDLETRKSHLVSVFKEGITPKPDKFEHFLCVLYAFVLY